MHKFELPADLLPALGKAHGTPFWLYDAATIRERAARIDASEADSSRSGVRDGAAGRAHRDQGGVLGGGAGARLAGAVSRPRRRRRSAS